jgi:hypothetical protein
LVQPANPLSSFASGTQRARVCLTLLALVDATERWTANGPAPGARVVPPRSADPDAGRLLAACWAIWEGCSTLTLDELLGLSPARLEAVGELLAALARGSPEIDAWLVRYGSDTGPAASPTRRAASAGRLKLTR